MRKFLQSTGLIFICFVLCNNYIIAQGKLSIKNFAVFGGDINASPIDSNQSGVEFASIVSVHGGGFIGSQTFVQFKDTVSVDGDIYGNLATVGSSFTLNGGSLFLYNQQTRAYNVLNVGPFALLSSPGNVTVNGNSLITNGTVNGSVTHPNTYTYTGPGPVLGEIIANPTFPTLPVMPDTATFPLAGATNITTTQTITPGVYGTMAITGGQTVTFSGVGTYVFASIANNGPDTFRYDFKNNVTGAIKIYIIGNADVGNIQVDIKNGGSAARIYTEIHGAGTAVNQFTSFSMNAANTFLSSTWAGTVLARNGAIKIGNTNRNSLNIVNGCMWSQRKVTIGVNTTFNFVPLSSSAQSVPNSLILPYYPPPADGKISTLIGSELTSLFEHPGSFLLDSIIYRISGSSVYVEVIALQSKRAATLNFLIANGLADTISNGAGSLIITGKFPIAKLLLLNTRQDLIDYVRPLFHPINNSGVVTTRGDTAMYSNLVRTGYRLTGSGVKVGVISDSYNTIPGNYAGIDVANGDLPGPGNPDNYISPVQVVGEYPFGQGVDEGRAMLQIVHDIAPKAQLAFRTGFVSAGDFAQGISALGTAGCNVIVDDVTYITEPYFKDGVVAKAVDNVVATGTTYFSAAGNFGKQSYEGTFNGMAAPAAIRGITGTVHNFGSGNPLQTINLTPGNYTIVLQWDDNIYSLGAPSSGTQTDLDLFLTDNTGSTLFGFNRNNIGGDPTEVLPFTVTSATTANIIIGKATGPNVPVKFKYIVFRGILTINNYSGSSTLVGQANSSGAIAVGAVLYSNTPPYGLRIPTIASFSSVGGALVNGTIRNKPELTAPNGVNTTVNFNNQNIDRDNFPNFFGTSAAAPHAAAAAALLIEGKQKFLAQTITPAGLKTLFETTALDMGRPGYDTTNGYGFIQPFAAMLTFASPIPEIDSLKTTNPITSPVRVPFTVTVKGKGLIPTTQVYFRGRALATTYVNNETVTAQIPAFSDNPPVQLFNPSIIPPANRTRNIDGGLSDSLFFFSTKKHILVTADNKTKKYGENLPVFTATITVDGVPLQNTALTAAGLKLDHLTYTTPASSSSNIANYFIHPVNPLNPAISADSLLLTRYTYEFVDGLLTIQKLPLKITPRDTTLTYGQKIHGLHFNYVVGPSANLQNPDSLINAIRLSYTASIIDSILAIINGSGSGGRTLTDADLANLSIMISSGSGATSHALVNNGSGTTQTTYIVDVDVTSIFNYLANPASSPLVNGSGATSHALVNTGPLIDGTASVIGNGSGATSHALVNGDPTLLNSNTTNSTSNTNVAVIISDNDVPAPTNNIITETSVNMITNGIAAGVHTIVPAAFISANFEITYGLGKLTINKAPLTIKANTQYTNNGVLPPFTSAVAGYQYQDASIPKTGPVYTITPTYTGQAGVYTIKPSGLVFRGDSDYLKTYVNGILYVNPYTSASQKIILSLKCVGKVTNNPSGFGYVAHFIAKNTNSTTIYILPGPDNYITATGKYSGVPPSVFTPGTTNFDVYFDGKKITWTVRTLQGRVKCTESVAATSTSCQCTTTYSDAFGLNDIISTNAISDKTGIYPNPATNRLRITSNTSFVSEKDVTVLDVYGRIMPVKAILKSAQTIDLNVSGLAKGTYFIRIREEAKSKLISFVKL